MHRRLNAIAATGRHTPPAAVLCLLLMLSTSPAADPGQEEVRFNRDVRPILSENCYFCHGFDKENRQAGLRLDVRADAVADLGGYAAIVPGDAEASEIFRRVTSSDPDEVMPPADSPYRLTEDQIKTLRAWINQGARYEQHWAYAPLRKPAAPGGSADPPLGNAAKGSLVIDAFLKARRSAEHLEPVGRADPRTLVRRLWFDLTGLPPSPEQVARFVADPSESRYEELVDRLLASREHAEHLASWWLDLVRWSDTSGMASDEPIDTQAYRSYVVDSFHRNKPFDRFTIEQLAGDLLDDATDETLVASGYNRLVRTNSEAGVIPDEALYAMKTDHVSALGSVWLGSTTACCQCHDHKYDPFTQRDFYRLAAFFDDLVEVGVYSPGDRRAPLHYVHPTAEAGARAAELRALRDKLTAELLRGSAELDAGQPDWEAATLAALERDEPTDFPWMPAELPAAYLAFGDAYQSTAIAGRRAREQSAPPGELRRHVLAEPLTGFFKHQKLRKGKFYVEVYLDPDDPPRAVAVQLIQGGYGRMGWRPDIYGTLVWGDDARIKSADWVHAPKYKRVGDLPTTGGWVRLEFPGAKTFPPIDGAYWHMGVAWAQDSGRVYWGDTGLVAPESLATEMRLGVTSYRMLDGKPLHRDVFERKPELAAAALKKPPGDRDAQEKAFVVQAYREAVQPELHEQVLAAERELLRLRRGAQPALVSKAGPPKVTHLVERGDFRNPVGDPLLPGTPEFLGELDVNGRPTRLDLARWLVSSENPLTARVVVNRLWARFFGQGLSPTLEDIGGQGRWPTHPELLDWLAGDLVGGGWDLRRLIKQMVMTDGYCLSAEPSPSLLEADPENRLLTRQRRWRHAAEVVRDNALAAAGLLRTGHTAADSVFPYQPDSYWDGTNKVMLGSRFLDYRASGADLQHTRTLYTFWKRVGTHPTLLAFDAPSRQSCVARRSVTNTPGQALVLLNDPIFVEAARSLAGRLLNRHNPTGEGRAVEAADVPPLIRAAYQQTLQRDPSPAEEQFLAAHYQEQRRRFAQQPAEAARLVAVGVSPRPAGLDPVEHAAWTSVCRVLLNLHESLVRM